MLTFTDEGHKYQSIDEKEKIKWTSVTGLIHKITNPFDSNLIATQVSKKKTSKWFGMKVSDIQAEWKRKNLSALERGTWYHNMIEESLCQFETIDRKGVTLPIIKPIIVDNVKYAPEQKLKDGVYPEHFVYLKSAGLCGQSDKVEVIQGIVDVSDLKTNEEIRFQSFKNWEGHKMMLAPMSHLMDCNWVEYCLQLSLYMYMILKHNPALRPGKITLTHILFEEIGRDKYDNPIYGTDSQGNYIIKGTMEYDVPYMKQECITLINYLKDNKTKF